MRLMHLPRLQLGPRFLAALALGLCLCLGAGLARAAGFAFIDLPAGQDGPALHGAVWYPCAAPAGRIALGPQLEIAGVRDCPVSGDHWPLIVMSHGAGGSFLGHHDTAAALADGGFVVAAISHPGDNFQDTSRQGQLSIFATRPADMKRLLDYMLERWPERGRLVAGQAGFFGFSRGGYTGLVAAGARPDFRLGVPQCEQAPEIPMCSQILRNELPPATEFLRDERIRAAVMADPLNIFDAEGLKQVRIPIQLWASAKGGDGVTPQSVEALRQALPAPPDFRSVPGAGHFAFMAPCPAALAASAPGICRDAEGFDRSAFHTRFNAELLAFYRRHLTPAVRR